MGDSTESWALTLVKVAVAVFPPLAELLGRVLAGNDEPLAAKVREILPVESASARAARELGG